MAETLKPQLWYGPCYGEDEWLLSATAVTLSVTVGCGIARIRWWMFASGRYGLRERKRGYSPFGRLVRSEFSIMWIFSY